jgi:hypothetical protein
VRGTTPESYGRPISHLAQEAIARVQMYNKKIPANSPVITNEILWQQSRSLCIKNKQKNSKSMKKIL